jgi:hypothetical protein
VEKSVSNPFNTTSGEDRDWHVSPLMQSVVLNAAVFLMAVVGLGCIIFVALLRTGPSVVAPTIAALIVGILCAGKLLGWRSKLATKLHSGF